MSVDNDSIKYFKNIREVEADSFKSMAKSLLDLEQKLYYRQSQTGDASKLIQIKFFKFNEEDISAFQMENVNGEILCDFARFLHLHNIIDDTQMQHSIDNFEENGTRFFGDYLFTSDVLSVETIENSLISSAFGLGFFEEFDYKQPNSAKAVILREKYEGFPKYEVEEIDQRNSYIKGLVTIFKTKSNESTQKHTCITFSYGCCLSDTSNSEWLVRVFIENSYALIYNYFMPI